MKEFAKKFFTALMIVLLLMFVFPTETTDLSEIDFEGGVTDVNCN